MPGSEHHASPPIPLAATVIPMRPAAEGPEILLLQRAAGMAFYGGAWVFPGGRVDPEDGDPAQLSEAGRRAAVRELREEAGLTVQPSALVLISRWITPPGLPRRFDTLHFVAPAEPEQPVVVQPEEVAGHRWLTAGEALQLHARGELELPPPTYVTLVTLAPMRSIAQACDELGASPFEFVPRRHAVDGGMVYLYSGDAAYESGELTATGPRHRLTVIGDQWNYER